MRTALDPRIDDDLDRRRVVVFQPFERVLKTAKPVRLKRKRKRVVRLGAARFSIAATRTKRVKIHLSTPKVRLVQKLKRLSAIAIVANRTDGARVTKHAIILKAAR